MFPISNPNGRENRGSFGNASKNKMESGPFSYNICHKVGTMGHFQSKATTLISEIQFANVQEEKREGLLMAKTTRRESPSKEKRLQPKEADNLDISKAARASP